MLKGVWGTRLASADVAAAAEEALAWHRERGASFVFWTAGPSTEPADLGPLLEPHGLQPWELEAPARSGSSTR
jgi:hypothetical protein